MMLNGKRIYVFVIMTLLLFINEINLMKNLNKLNKNSEKSENTKEKNLSKLLRLNTEEEVTSYNGGNWDDGFKCPKFLLVKDKGSFINQGGVLLKAKEIVENTTDDNKKGLLLEFENPPAHDSLILKVGIKITAYKIYIPWRFFQTDVAYKNPLMDNKNIKGSLFTDNQETYYFKIILPYQRLSYYISDEQGMKIVDAIISISKDVNEKIIKAKNSLNAKSTLYFSAKNHLKEYENAKKNSIHISNSLENENRKLNEEKKINESLKKERSNILKEYTNWVNNNMKIQKQYKDLNSKIEISSKDIVLMYDWNKKLKDEKEIDKIIKEENEKKNKAFIESMSQYETLNKYASERKKELDLSQAGLKAENKKQFLDNLEKIYDS